MPISPARPGESSGFRRQLISFSRSALGETKRQLVFLCHCVRACTALPIAPARMLLGDLAELEGDNPIGTICLYAGNGNLFGFHQDHPGLVTLQPEKIIRSWSVL